MDVLGLPAAANAEAAIESTAAAIREKLGLHCVVVHPRKGAGRCDEGRHREILRAVRTAAED